jgi:hypothetical protein
MTLPRSSSQRGSILVGIYPYVELIKLYCVLSRSMVLSRRPNDDDRHDGFVKWPFMTTHTWGENPRGTWTLEVNTKP